MTPLHALAGALGIEPLRPSAAGEPGAVPDYTLLALCRALGADVHRPEDAAAALDARAGAAIAAGLEPVAVAWDGAAPVLTRHCAPGATADVFDVVVELESGDVRSWKGSDCGHGEPRHTATGAVSIDVVLPTRLPTGAHTVTLTAGARSARATILCAPRRLPFPFGDPTWGLFVPTYALHDEGADTGDFRTLHHFATWAASRGARVVGTLPLLATFLGAGSEPCDPSPYAPVSRRFWNEVFLDVEALGAGRGLEADRGRTVDLPRVAAARRRRLEPLAEASRTDLDLHRWRRARPEVTDYARFRAEREGSGENGVRYHEYVQWQCEQQLARLARDLETREQVLSMDFPVGTHRDGFDVARQPDLFVRDVSVGAPPDSFQSGGQNWGFPPLAPDATRRTGHAYLRECLGTQLRFSKLLRIDHVMGMHRLWFVPENAPATDGAYVRYAAEEQWAAVCVVAAQHGAGIVGEDLGTVAPETEAALEVHGALGMWVAQFDVPATGAPVPPSRRQLACTSTHDLPTFATWWHELDRDTRTHLVLALPAIDSVLGRSGAPDDAPAVLRALYAWLGRSEARVVIAMLEDLWLETEPQNRPGTPGRENFRGRAAYPIEAFDDLAHVTQLLSALDAARRRTDR
jgi:4-alpha-glucanotransferase